MFRFFMNHLQGVSGTSKNQHYFCIAICVGVCVLLGSWLGESWGLKCIYIIFNFLIILTV
jgi:hypothetical protein